MDIQIENYKCIMCKEPFSPPLNLPYLLPCTHSLCANCLHRAVTQKETKIICPEDLQSNAVCQIKSNSSARRALQRLVHEHKNYNQNNQLLCIQSLSRHFEHVLDGKQKQRSDFQQLLDKVFTNQMRRLQQQQQRIRQQLSSPYNWVQQWKQMVRKYLTSLRQADRSCQANIFKQLNYYIEEGRKIKQQLADYQLIKFQEVANVIVGNPGICFSHDFSIRDWSGKEQMHGNSQSGVVTARSGREQDNNQFQSKKKSKHGSGIKTNTVSAQVSVNFGSNRSQLHQDSKNVTSSFRREKRDNLNTLNQLKTAREDYQTVQKGLKQQHALRQLNVNSQFLTSNNSSCADKRQLLIYSPDYQITEKQQVSQHPYDELLLTDKQERKGWELGNFNFMQQWQISKSQPIQSIQTKKRQAYNWDQQRNNYIRRMQQLKAQQAKHATYHTHNCIQLINYSLQEVDMDLYLQIFDWNVLQVVKLVKTNLSDGQLNQLLNFVLHSQVTTLVLCGNSLSQLSLDALLNFKRVNSTIRNVYLSKNNVNCLKGNTRTKISMLRELGLNLYI